jgi:nucleotidyltransferase/DNA polymerase involved in DNA repair
MFALADVNSFYASCERVFRPDLKADSRPEQQRRERNRSQCRGEALDQNGNSVVSDKKRKVPGKNIFVFK